MGNELDDAFDAPSPAPATSSLDAEFDALPESPAPAAQPAPIAPSVTGFTADELDPAQETGARHQRLKLAFDAAQDVGDKAHRAYRVKEALGVKYSDALMNLDGFEAAARTAQFDPARYEQENPVLARLLERRPELADVVMTDKDVPWSVQAWNAALNWNQRPVKTASPGELKDVNAELAQQADARNQTTIASTPMPAADPLEAARNDPLAPVPAPNAPPQSPEDLAAAQAAFDAARVKESQPVKQQELNDPKAKVAKEYGGILVPFLRAKEAAAEAEIAQAQIDLMMAEVRPGDWQDGADSAEAIDARGRLDDLKAANIPRAYGDDNGLSRQLAVGIQGGYSSVKMLEESVKGATVASAVSGTVTGAAAVALSPVKTPAVFLRGFVAGAELAAPEGAKLGAGWASFNMELGPTYETDRDLVTDDGQKLTPREAFGLAVAESAVKAGLETLSFGVQTKALAGGAAAVRDRLRGQLLTNPTFRKQIVELGLEWAKGTASEGATGGLQDLVEQVGDYLGKSAKQGQLQKGDIVDVPRMLTASEAEAAGGALFGGGAGILTLGMAQTAKAREQHLNSQVPSLLQMAQSETFKTAPDAFAEVVREATGETGAPATSIHVDGEAVQRFFQENESDPDAANKKLVELVGPEGPAKLTEALATGGKMEIDLERVPAWASSDIGKALVASTSMDPASLSPQQQSQRAPEIKAEAKRIAADAESVVKEDAELEAALPDVEKQLVATGRASAREASAAARLWKAFSTTMAKDFGMPAKALFERLQVSFGIGDEGQLGLPGVLPGRIDQPAAPADLAQHEANLTDDERRAAMYVDDVTGLHTRRAWDARQVTPGTQVGLISIPDVKAINDHEKGGHDVTNRLLRLFGSKLGAVTEGRQSARSGTDFLVEVKDQAQLDAIVTQLQGVAPQGVRVLGFTGKDVSAAGAAEKAGTTAMRALPEGDPARLLPRGQTAFDRSQLTDSAFDATPAKRTVPDALAKAAPLKGEAFVRDILMSSKVPGLRSRAGFEAAGPRKFSASVDMRGLKNINAMMQALHEAAGLTPEQANAEGQKVGDEVMRVFGEAALRAGAGDVFFAHMSGDEFAAKADTKELLDLFVSDLQAELQKAGVGVTLTNGTVALLRPNFRSGVAEGSYGKADQQLNRDKALEPAEPAGLSPSDSLRRSGVLVDGVEGQGARDLVGGAGDSAAGHPGRPRSARGVGEAPGGTQGAGAPVADQGSAAEAASGAGRSDAQVPDGGARAGLDAEAEAVITEREARGPLRAEEVEAVAQGFNLPDHVDEARKAIARMKGSTVKPIEGETKKALKERTAAAKKALVERRAAAEAFVAWVENTGPGIQEKGTAYGREGALQVSPELLKATERWAQKEFNLIDPQSGLSALTEAAARGTNDYKGAKKKTQQQPVELAKHNAGGSNDTLVNILKQEDDKKKAPRGYLELPSGGALVKVYHVFLNKRADASTVVHESGHVFLEMMRELTARPDAPARARETYQAARKWLGMEENQVKPTKEQHEKFAKGFEAYLYEGKAPTDALDKVFTRFKLWLTRIYRSVASLDVELNDDIRKVFDRLLATDDEFKKERAETGPRLFATAEEAGMTPEEFAAYSDDLDQAEEHAKRRSELHVLRERLVEHEAWWQAELKDVTAKAAEDYERLQARKAQRILGGVDIGEVKGEPVVFDRAAVDQMVGKGAAKQLLTTDENGTHPDEVAEFTGYPTGGAMLAAVLSLPSKDTWVKREAEARMQEQNPKVFNDRSKLRKLVAEGLHGVTEKRLLEERAALRAKGAKPGMGAATSPIEAINQAGKMIVEKTQLGQLQPRLALGAERRAANDAVRFAVTGNTEKALEANTRQLLNAAVYREAMAAADEKDGLLELAREMSTQKARARWGKASPKFRDAIDFLLGAVQLTGDGKLAPEEWAAGWAAVTDAVALMEEDGVGVGDWEAPLGEMLLKNDWRALTVKEMRTLRSALENLRAAARQKNTVIVDGKRVERETVVAELIREMGAVLPRQSVPGTASSATVGEKALKAWNAFDAFLANPQDAFRQLSGDNPDSMIWRALAMPMQHAKQREADLLKSTIKPIIEAFEAVPADIRKRSDEAIDGAKLFPNHDTRVVQPPRRRHELWVMALNYGNEGNAQRLRDGRNITDEQVRNALNLLTKEELAWVQTVLDAHEALRPEAFDLEERDSGIRPEAVPARPLQLTNGTLKGGYFPIAYERGSQVGKKQAASLEAGLMDATYGRGSTPRGHLKQRADAVLDQVVTLDPRRLFSNYAQVAHDIAFREAVKSVNALLTTKEVEGAMQERVGIEKTEDAQQWVKDIGQMRAAEVSDRWGKANRWMRANLAPALLGYYLPNAIGDFANLAAAVASTPLQGKHLAAGLSEFASERGDARKAALEKSGELRFMQDELARDFQQQVKSLSKGTVARGFEKVKNNAFVFMEAVSVATATPVWIGAYRQALAEGKSEQQARDFGDDVLRRVFPSHSVVDKAAILRDKGFWGTVTVFYGYLSVAARATRWLANPLFTQDFRDSSASAKATTAAGVGMRMAGFFIAYQVLGELLMGRGPEDGDRDEDEPGNEKMKWARWFRRKMLIAPVSLVPIPGMATLVENKLLDKRGSPKADPLGGFIGSVAEVIMDGLTGKAENFDAGETAKRLGRIGGLATGAPIRPLGTTGQYVKDLATGDRKPNGVLRTASGLIYGERDNQPATPLTVLADIADQLLGK